MTPSGICGDMGRPRSCGEPSSQTLPGQSSSVFLAEKTQELEFIISAGSNCRAREGRMVFQLLSQDNLFALLLFFMVKMV